MERHGTDKIVNTSAGAPCLNRVGGVLLDIVAALHGRALLYLLCNMQSMLL